MRIKSHGKKSKRFTLKLSYVRNQAGGMRKEYLYENYFFKG